MLRKSATTVLIIEATRKVHANVGVLSLPELGVRQSVEALMEINTGRVTAPSI